MTKRLLLLLPIVLLAGCASRLTNLTPQQVVRTETHLYPFEVAMKSSQQALVWESIQPYVVVGTDLYPMRLQPLMTNRWEALVPIPANNNLVHYHFKFDYLVNTIGPRKPDSAASQTYSLRLLDTQQ